MNKNANVRELKAMYADFSACLLAITNALHAKGVLTKAELQESAQERLLDVQTAHINGELSEGISLDDFGMLRQMATALSTSPLVSLTYSKHGELPNQT